MTGKNNIQTITISRQSGSLGFEVARLVANKLAYRLVWRELINQAAQRAGVPEVALSAIDELGLLGLCPMPEACHAYRQAVEQIMLELANAGRVVIIGRAGQVILKDRPDILHVRLIAPFHTRAERLSSRYNISIECAQAQIEASDRFRSRYLKRFYNASWDNPQLYDIVINTGRLSPIEAAQIIIHTIDQYNKFRTKNIEETQDFGIETAG